MFFTPRLSARIVYFITVPVHLQYRLYVLKKRITKQKCRILDGAVSKRYGR